MKLRGYKWNLTKENRLPCASDSCWHRDCLLDTAVASREIRQQHHLRAQCTPGGTGCVWEGPSGAPCGAPALTSSDCAFFLRKRFHLLIFRERGREGEREGEKHWSAASCSHPDQELNLQPSHVPWPWIEQTTFHFAERRPTNWATLVRADHASWTQLKWE